jgi:hypothetical protein
MIANRREPRDSMRHPRQLLLGGTILAGLVVAPAVPSSAQGVRGDAPATQTGPVEERREPGRAPRAAPPAVQNGVGASEGRPERGGPPPAEGRPATPTPRSSAPLQTPPAPRQSAPEPAKSGIEHPEPKPAPPPSALPSTGSRAGPATDGPPRPSAAPVGRPAETPATQVLPAASTPVRGVTMRAR